MVGPVGFAVKIKKIFWASAKLNQLRSNPLADNFTRILYVRKKWWARSDLNRRHAPCKGTVIAARPRAHEVARKNYISFIKLPILNIH